MNLKADTLWCLYHFIMKWNESLCLCCVWHNMNIYACGQLPAQLSPLVQEGFPWHFPGAPSLLWQVFDHHICWWSSHLQHSPSTAWIAKVILSDSRALWLHLHPHGKTPLNHPTRPLQLKGKARMAPVAHSELSRAGVREIVLSVSLLYSSDPLSLWPGDGTAKAAPQRMWGAPKWWPFAWCFLGLGLHWSRALCAVTSSGGSHSVPSLCWHSYSCVTLGLC